MRNRLVLLLMMRAALTVREIAAYYVLDLFCRAMPASGRSVSDVLMLVRSAHVF